MIPGPALFQASPDAGRVQSAPQCLQTPRPIVFTLRGSRPHRRVGKVFRRGSVAFFIVPLFDELAGNRLLAAGPALGKEFLRHRVPPFPRVSLTAGGRALFHGAPVLDHHADPLSGLPRPLEGPSTVERLVKLHLRPVRDALHLFCSSFRIRVFAYSGVSCPHAGTVNGCVYGHR